MSEATLARLTMDYPVVLTKGPDGPALDGGKPPKGSQADIARQKRPPRDPSSGTAP